MMQKNVGKFLMSISLLNLKSRVFIARNLLSFSTLVTQLHGDMKIIKKDSRLNSSYFIGFCFALTQNSVCVPWCNVSATQCVGSPWYSR